MIAVAGNGGHDDDGTLDRQAFGSVLGDASPEPPRLSGPGAPLAVPGVRLVSRRTEQANIVLGTDGLARTDERRFALGVLNAALGGGMSSRLFQEGREKRGLAYSVYSCGSQPADSGTVGGYACCLRATTGA